MIVLSEALRVSTREGHIAAETSPFIVSLMKGALDLSAYTRYLVNMAWLYEALERKSAVGTPVPGSDGLWDDRLWRITSITNDLDNLGVPDWRNTTKPSRPMQSYVAHLDSLTGRDDPRLISQHYTRYLGDLSGGQAIATLVARHYGATQDQLSFYRFDKIDNLVRFKETYRLTLDAIELDPLQRKQVLDEAKGAFIRHAEVFNELEKTT